MPGDRAVGPAATSLESLIREADRQLRICNACRYCEGYCAVFPALERRTLLTAADVSQLANLCHDCRACFDACMYTPPHEFELNVPRVLAEVRVENYDRYLWPHWAGRLLRGWRGVALGVPLITVVLALIAMANAGPAGLIAGPHGPASPYAILPYPVLLAVVAVPFILACTAMAAGALRYWADVGGAPSGLWPGAVLRALGYSATLRYLGGGRGGCFFPRDDQPSGTRRYLHALVAYGLGLCVASTVSAAVLQDLLGSPPPYPFLSVPVMTGTVGGAAMVTGCSALLWMKAGSSRVTSSETMIAKDYALLMALDLLALSGLGVLLARTTPAFGLLLLLHLVSIAAAFISAPYSKFVHVSYRFLALVRDNLEAGMRQQHGDREARS